MSQPTFAQRIRELRGNATQEEFAKRCGVSTPTVSDWENAYRTTTAYILCQICDEYGISCDWLLGLSDVQARQKAIVCKAVTK
jgi:transcriptional regulator with XRE-family HTH domain